MKVETFQYCLPVNLIFGWDKAEEIGKEAKKYGKKALIVTGQGSTKKSGLLDRVLKLLETEGMESVVYDKAVPNPLASTAKAGAAVAKEEGCDVVIGLGGGSIMDCAKAVAFLAVNEGEPFDYIYGKKQSDRSLPIVLVPTTCGTGSEGNGFAVLTDDETLDKKSLRTNAIVAKASIIDPKLMTTMPKSVFASVGFDALCHCMEAYLSKTCQPIVELEAICGIQLLGENLLKAYNDYNDKDAWSAVTLASTFGGMVINQAGVVAPHGLEHPASGLRNITHGRGLAALTPVIYERSISSAPEKFAKISQLLGGTDETDCVAKIRELLSELSLTITLSEQGVKEEDVDWMVENAFKVSAPAIANHPKVFTAEEVKEIYLAAL
ncbi:MAG: iron-containing alcohol dehydrogenase [Clostridia bacterium]|nr:iron-containing alcohol dehydrogenase [Clostridia bacterium]NCC44472.1 iron-containing alcohol dehydrogenase [Clostridia bacterium]